MKRSWKIGIALVGALVAALVVGGVALASHGHHDFIKRRIVRHIDQALDAVGASPEQRAAVHAARDQVFTTFEETHAAERGNLDKVLTLWQADRIDPAALAALRAEHVANARKTGDAIVQALSDAHDALTSAQRQKLAAYLQANRPPKLDGARPFVRHMVNEHVDDLLDQIHATADQRTKVQAAVGRAFDVVSVNMADHGAHFDEAVGIFTADTIDRGKLAALQAERQAQLDKTADAVVQALGDIHDALDAGQRKQVADFVRAHHAGHGG